jgi:Helix-turn-helix domain
MPRPNVTTNTLNRARNVVELSGFGRKPRHRPADKWTKGLISLGFCTVPSILMWAQGRLGLSTEQFTVVLQLADFWWDAGEPPFPTKDLLAGRMGMGARQVQRHLTALEDKGIIKRVPRYRGPKNQIANGYDMSPLVKKLVALEPEFRKMIEQKRLRRQKIERKAAS